MLNLPSGQIVVSNNDGSIGLLDPNNPSSGEVIIASGGVRGDVTSMDTSNGTPFIADQVALYRLGIAGGSFTTPTDVPEPASATILALGLAALARSRGRGRARRKAT